MDKRVDATHPALPEGLRKIRDWLVAGPRVDLVGETWSASRLGETFTTLNLASEETLVEVAAGDAAAVDNPRQAFDGRWARLAFHARDCRNRSVSVL